MLFGNCYHGNSCYDNTHVVAKVIVAVVTYNVCDVAFYMDSMSPRTSCVQLFSKFASCIEIKQ